MPISCAEEIREAEAIRASMRRYFGRARAKRATEQPGQVVRAA